MAAASDSDSDEDVASYRVAEWVEGLPSASDLVPLHHPLIPPDLLAAFDLYSSSLSSSSSSSSPSPELDSGERSSRAPKRPRLVWTPELHKRFVDVVAHLGIQNAVPKTIMQLMNVDGLTRENVASHLQKYRLYLKRMKGIPEDRQVPSRGLPALLAPLPAPATMPATPGYAVFGPVCRTPALSSKRG